MKIIGIVGSPRVEGNTQKLVEIILESSAENGAETKIFNLNKMDIKGCQSCYHCRTTDEGCAIKDDMPQLFEEIKQSDALIIGSPIYFGQMSGQLKLFVDRHYSKIKTEFRNKIGKKDLVLVYTHGNSDTNRFKQYIDFTSLVYSFMGYKVKDTIIAPGLRNIGAIYQEPMLVEKAKEIGKQLLQN